HQEDVAAQLRDKVVLVTGGGGSIGSELCRQIAKYDPKQLIIFDVYENNAYDIQLELKRKYPNLDLVTLIGSVRDARRINSVFETYRPNICYHAAAHKHVPLMEDSPCEAIKNNAVGTYKTAYAAMKYGCDRFVLISTDKAVNPTNVMGATKRICEMIIQTFDNMVRNNQEDKLPVLITHQLDIDMEDADKVPAGSGHTEYVAVRFGNVLGSNGSVVPLFKKQIAEGGPVTLTHKDIIRYFMTIPEAVSLVLKAGANASGGEIFVLDMGEPVKILDLARNMIELAGLRPDIDIEIEYIGLRPGEKLYEEKLMSEEGLKETENHLIHVAEPIKFDSAEFLNNLRELMSLAYSNEAPEVVQKIRETVPTFKG
ncbi:MAG: polysaccharide biosynthesis protein, partial [Pseudobutyrivibrio sp.]|nr:polysaccharide biosynthesis protein [Pseudobutyrivibrio sp.]